MLYDLSLEKLARQQREGDRPASREHLQALLDSGEEHPEHLGEILLEALQRGPLAETLEDRLWLLEHLDGLPWPGQTEVYESFLVEILRAQEPHQLGRIAPGLRRRLAPPGSWDELESHLLRMSDVCLRAAEAGETFLFHALFRYVCRRLGACRRPPRTLLLQVLAVHRLAAAFLLQEEWEDWLPPTLRSLRLALQSPRARTLCEREPELVGEHLEPLWTSLAELVAAGRFRRLEILLDHLLWLSTLAPSLEKSRRHLSGLRQALPRSALRDLEERLPPPTSCEAPPPFPTVRARLQELAELEERRQQVCASLRPRSRKHLARYLHLAGQFYQGDSTVAALYPEHPPYPHPLVTLYFPRGRTDSVARLARGPLEIALQKHGESYRLYAFHPNSGQVLTAQNLLGEVETLPFRRALTFSAGRYAVALVELETLEIWSLRPTGGYLDFTGTYYRGIELELSGETRQAIRELEKALAANPRLRGAHCRLGHCFRKLARSHRDLVRAQGHYERELASFPGSADSWNSLGLLTLAQGDLETARGLLEQAVEADPHHLAALTNLGLVQLAEPQRPESRERFGEVLKALRSLDASSPSLDQLLSQEGGCLGRDWRSMLRTEA